MKPTDIQARLDRIAHLILDKVELVLDILKRGPAPEGPLTPERAHLWRWANNRLDLWRKCRNRSCRRARRCKGEPRQCLRRHAPTLPAPLRNRVRAEMRARVGAAYSSSMTAMNVSGSAQNSRMSR